MEIGNRLRELRLRNGLTQEELADRCELTKGFISQLERDKTSPSISTLEDVLQCLGTSLPEFFAEEAAATDEQIVFTKDDYFEKEDPEKNHTVEWIIPNAQKNEMEPIRLTLAPGGETWPEDPHEGEEFGYVLAGSIRLILGDRSYPVKKGESFYFTADRPHFIKANAKTGAVVLWVTSPPSF